MKYLVYLLIILLAASTLLITACGGTDNPTNPIDIDEDDFDWHIMFIQMEGEAKESYYSIAPVWLGPSTALSGTDTFSMKIDGDDYEIEGYYMFGQWLLWGSAYLNPGQQYNVKFYRNNDVVVQADIRMPYAANASFPSTYNPSQSTSFNWSLSTNNQYQYAGVEAWNMDAEEDEDYDDFIKNIPPGDRSFTVPANAVENLGPGTEYDLIVMQMNFAKQGRGAFTAMQSQSSTYYKNGFPTEKQQRERGIALISAQMHK